MISDEEALKRFSLRKRLFAIVGQVDNGDLPAGSPMFFYCWYCSDLVDELPEDYTTVPKRYCDECSELISRKLLLEERDRVIYPEFDTL